MCVHLDGLNAEHKFQVWVTILGHTSLHFTSLQPLRGVASGYAGYAGAYGPGQIGGPQSPGGTFN